ncbi:UNVERIFIED_CONTAM: hypothetical protein FKN15_067876 [Acipenser sinensis]
MQVSIELHRRTLPVSGPVPQVPLSERSALQKLSGGRSRAVHVYMPAWIQSYKCDCEPGWVGMNCDLNRNECHPNPCLHGGTCTDQVNGYTCKCKEGFRGTNRNRSFCWLKMPLTGERYWGRFYDSFFNSLLCKRIKHCCLLCVSLSEDWEDHSESGGDFQPPISRKSRKRRAAEKSSKNSPLMRVSPDSL